MTPGNLRIAVGRDRAWVRPGEIVDTDDIDFSMNSG
jgi:hypothetical protein